MPIIKIEDVKKFELPRITGSHVQGVRSMEVWVQTISPGAATPIHCHACEEVIVMLTGSGECTVGGKTTTFGPNTTLILEPDVVHQIVNTSKDDMKLIAALGMAPVRVKTGEGDALPLPWEAPVQTPVLA
jgi:quercetin dioxygenase-like cupin family protein